jgi:hypothetical protein
VSDPLHLTFPKEYTACLFCSGSGKWRCSRCTGSGGRYETRYEYDYYDRRSRTRSEWVSCSSCCGSGSQTCYSCGGGGSRRR